MSRGKYSAGKRQREADKARKKQEKLDRLRRNRDNRPTGEVPIASVEEIVGPLGTPGARPPGQGIEDSGHERSHSVPCRLFVGGLSWGTEEDDLRAAFTEYGPVSDVVVVTDRDTGRSRGFGFVTMSDRKDAAKAVKALDGSELDGRTLKVTPATERRR
jgi:hypothetical protein